MTLNTKLLRRLSTFRDEITLGMNCAIRIGQDPETERVFWQIQCYRMDVITKEMGYGFGGKYYPSEHSSDSELLNMIFGAYKSYWEHEARETFEWRGRRVYGPHISIHALYDAAPHVDVRSVRHVEDQPIIPDGVFGERTRQAVLAPEEDLPGSDPDGHDDRDDHGDH